MENQNKIVESILAKEKAKGATKPKDIKPTQGMSIAEKIVAKEQGTQQQLADLATSIGANAEAMQGALAHRDYEKTKANTAKMLDETSLDTKPYATSEDVKREQVQTFMDKKAEEARARGMKDYLDNTIGAWSADRVSSIVGGLTDADAERIRRGAERVSQLKQEGETPKVAELSIPRAEVDVQLPKSITEANMQMDAERTKGVSKISFSGLADRSKKEASKVVKDYLAENPHMEANAEMLEAYVANNIYNDTFKWKLENDEQFFADAYEATTGKSYAEYKREVDNEAREKLQSMKRELEAMNEVLKKKRDENRTNAGQSRSAFSAAWSDLKNTFGGNIEEIENLIDEIDNVLEGSFSSGFDKGFDFDSMTTMGLSGVFTEGEMANALKKANNGESLTEEEENYVRIHQYAQELDQLKKVREKYAEQMYDKFLGFNVNSIGEGVGTTVEMMPAFAGGMTATGMIGKFTDIGGKAALKSALHAGGKELFKYGVKTTGKLGYNYGLAKARGLAAAPFMPSTYNTYLESLNSAYSFDDNGNLTYKPVDKTQSYFGAVFSTANEISSEYLGIGIGKVVGWGARGVGRMAANTKIAETLVDAGKKARKHLPKLTPQTKVAMRTLGVQADPISETLSEALGDIMTSYEQSMIGMDVDMSQYGTFDYWMTLAGVTLAYGGSIAAMGAVKSYADVRSAVKERDAILGKISNRNLYNTLLAVSTSDDVVLASSALADFDWNGNGIKPEDEDRRLAEAYVAADLNVKIMEGAVEEGSRLDKFRGTIEGVRNIVYQGKAGEYSDKIFEAEVDGKKVFVVNGFEEDSTTNLYVVVDAATGEKSSVDKSKVKLTREVDVDTYIQEAYTNAFSLESEKSRVKDVREKALQMENPTEKDVQRVASTLNIALPKVGDAVMLANGNMGSVTERLSPTEYAVQDLSGATYKVHFTDILSTDKLTATAQSALVRGEASTPISTTEASVAEASAEDVTPDVTEPATDENGIVIGSEVTVDGRVGTVRARTENGDYVVSFEDESGNYENAEVEVYTPTEMASLMGVAPMPSATTESTTEGTPTTTEVATTEDGRVDIEQMSAEDAAKVLVERAGTIEEAIAQVKQVIETVTEERKKMAKAEKKASLNDVGKKSAELQALDTRLEFYGEVLGVLEAMLAEQQKQTMKEAKNIAEEAGVAPTTTEETTNEGNEKSVEPPTSGLIRNGAEMKFTDNVIRMVDFIAQRLGVTVEFVDDLKNEAGQPINGDIKGKHVRISTKGDRGVKFIVGHEFFHRIKDNVDEATYNKYIGALKEFFGEERWEEALNAQKRKYRAHNVAVAKKSMEGMTPEEVAAIAQQLGVNIEGLSAEDAKNAVARAAMRKAEQGDKVARTKFPTMLTYSDDLMLEETAADISGEMVANLDAFSNFVEDNKSEYAIIRGIHKALRYINDMFAAFGQTTRQRKVKRLIKNLDSIMAEAVKNEREGVKKARQEAKKKGVQGSEMVRNSLPSLVGVHNLSLDKLRKVIKMGGLANPSVAVIDVDKQTHEDYGEYSLILPKNMVDARQGKNAGTWAGDAWTPTYPQVVKRMNDDKAISRFYKDIDALPEAMRSRVRLDFDSFMDGRSANALAYWYLFEKGNAPEMVLVPSRYSNDVTNAVSEATKGSFSMFNLTPEERAECLDAYIAVKFDGDRTAFEAEMQARIERLAETIETKKSDRVKKWAQDTIDSIKKYGFDYDDVAEFIRDVGYDVKEKGKINVGATIMAAQERINESNLAAEYDAWRNNLDERYGIEEYIFDGYTNSGNRRYLPHTVENASKWMKKQGRQGAVATFPSFGTFVAVSIPKMTTLESIRKRKALLGKSKEEYDAFREKWENVYYELGKKLQPDAKSFEEYGYWRLIEAVGQKNPKEFIKKEYGVELSEEDMTQLKEMLNAIRTEYPARYFETKFERPLQLSDFTAAVVPNDIPLDVESRLKDANVEVIEYEKGDNASRAEAMQKASQMENVRFSLIGEIGASALDKAEEATIRLDNLAVARDMEAVGEDAKAIRMATGWERGADGLWRYEIMDAEVNLYDGDENTIRKKIEVAEEEEKDFMQQSKADTKELRERTNTYLAEMREKYGVAEGEETDVMTEEEIANLQSLTNKEIEFEDYKERRRNELYNRRMALEAQLAYVSVKNSEAPAEIAATRLGHILQGKYAEQIFKAYPTLRDMGVKFVTSIRDNAYAAYASSGSMKWLELNVKKTTLNDVAFYIAHEIQHAIQDIEGFANGGNLSTITSKKERILEAVAKATDYKMPVYDNYGAEDLENALTKNMQSYRPDTAYGVVYKDAIQSVAERFGYEDIYALINDWDNIEGKYDTYKRIAGEVEARNVSARLNMTPEERRATLLSETEDVAREDQIFLREGAEMAMAQPKFSLPVVQGVYDALKEYEATSDIETFVNRVRDVNDNVALGHPFLTNAILDYDEFGAEEFERKVRMIVGDYDDGGYAPYTAGGVRYSLPYNGDVARVFEDAIKIARSYNIPQDIIVAGSLQDYKTALLSYGVPEEKIILETSAVYLDWEDVIVVNAVNIFNPAFYVSVLAHENMHAITRREKDKVEAIAKKLPIMQILKFAEKEFGYSLDYIKNNLNGVSFAVVDEIISTFVEQIAAMPVSNWGYVLRRYLTGSLTIDEAMEACELGIAELYKGEYEKLTDATKGLLRENLIKLRDEQYKAEKVGNTIFWGESGTSNGGGIAIGEENKEDLRAQSHAPNGDGTTERAEADRRGEGADAQEVTRFMLPDPDPSEVFYDEIPIFDEQGNEIDITTLSSEEAQAILDSKVRQMLEAEYEHNISTIRKEAREARQAIIDRYYEEKNKRKKSSKPSRTNAARIDDILGDKPFESLPYEDQALILIATGQAKIRWSDKGAQRGLASELGLKGSKGDKHAYRSIWSGATKSFNEVVHDWWESIGGQERGIDDQDLRNALIEAFQSVQNAKDAMGEIVRKYDDLSAERDAALAEADRMEEKDLREAKAAYEHHYANFELSEGDERTSYHDRAAQFFGNQSLSRTDEILEDLTNELERQKRKIERLKAENKDIYTPLAEGIQKSKDIILHALERLRMFAGMEEVDLNDVARLINLVKTARSQRQVENLGAQATALVQRISIKKAKANLYRLLSLKLSNTDVIHKMLAESDKWTKEERDAILKHLWKVSRNGLRVSKAVHRDTKEIFDELKRLVYEFRKEKLKGLDNEQKASAIDGKLAELEQELHPEVIYDSEGNVQDNSNLPTDFNADNKPLAKTLFKTYLKMLAAEAKYRNASKILSEKIENKEQTGNAYADVVTTREDYLHALKQLNSTLEDLILKGKDDLRDWNAQKEKHEIEIRRMGIEAIGGEKADSQGKRSKWGARQRARWNTSVNAPYWTFETVLEKIDHKTPYKKGRFFSYFMDKWSDANDDLITRYMAHFEELGEAMSKCFPNDATFMKMKRNPYRMFQYIMRKAESTPIGTITYKEGDSERQMVLNVANAMYIIAMWRQPRYQEAMKERGITQQGVDTLMQSIASKDAGFIDFMDWVNEKFLPSTRLEYDVVFRKMNGGSMPKEVNYFPARVAAHQEVDLANIENGAMPTTPTALKDRTSHNIMPEMGMDYFKVLEAHIEDMDKWAAYAELTADLNVLLSSDEFRRRLNEYMGGLGGDGGGKGSLYELFKQTSLIATGLYRGDAGMQAFLGQLQKAWATSNIALRGWTAVKQISSVTTGMFDNIRFYKHALKAASIVGIYSEIKDAMKVSPSLRQRWKSGAAGMEALAREAQRADGYTVHRGAYEKSRDAVGDAIKLLVRAGMTPNAAVDLLSCSIIVNSVYETEIARLTGGKREATEEEKRAAVRKAERAFNTTQQSSEGAYLAPVQANPAFGVLTTYMNASFALHRKRMAGVKELWKLMTSKEYRRFIKDEYGEDAAKMSAVDAMKDIMSGIAGELSFAAMGWDLMEFMTWVNSWFNDDGDDDDTAAAKAEFADVWWQSFLNGYLGGSLATSMMQGFDTSLTPAYDEFISDVKGIFDDKGDAVNEVAQVVAKYGLGVDLKALYKAGVGFRNLFEDDERVGAILMLLNAPDRYVKAFVGDRREGETMEEYQTRIVRFYTLFDDVKYSDYFDEEGKYIGEDAPSIIMSKTKAQTLRKEYEAAYRKDILHHYGGKEAYASYMDTEKKYKDICELLGWKAETKPSKEKRKLSDLHKELAYEQKQVAKKAEKRKNWVGSEEGYYDKLMDEQKAKDELINQYYEYIKQSGLGAY